MKRRLILLLALLQIIVPLTFAANNPVRLWEKKLTGYVGDLRIADNGNVLFFYKTDIMSPNVDIVACNKHGDFFWNKRFINKVRSIDLDSSGDKMALVYLQPRQIGFKPIVMYLEKAKEKWQMPGGEFLSFSPSGKYLLSYNDGNSSNGIFLFNSEGKLSWSSDKLSLLAGQADDEGKVIFGLQKGKVVFINTATNSVDSFPIRHPVLTYAYDALNKLIFIADADKVTCFDNKNGECWQFAAKHVYRITPNQIQQKVLLYTPGKAYAIPYDQRDKYYNQAIPGEEVLKQLEVSRDLYSISLNHRFLTVYKQNNLILYEFGVE